MVDRYKEKPVVVEAVQYNGHNIDTIWEAFGTTAIHGRDENNPDWLIVATPFGDRNVHVGDWIIKTSKGDLKVLDPKNFDARYELGNVTEDELMEAYREENAKRRAGYLEYIQGVTGTKKGL